MSELLKVEVDSTVVEKSFRDELRKRLDEIQNRKVLWDMKELCRQTCMSENNIKEKFFYDQRFPKRKIGGKWYFAAKECEEFLLTWLSEQPTN